MSKIISGKIRQLLKYSFPYVNAQNIEPVVAVHGGAGDVIDEMIPAKKQGVKLAAKVGYKVLRDTGNVLDAVQYAVQALEENANFNAGLGGVLNMAGELEMDASIIDGSNLKAGCVSLVKDILHPICLARKVMEQTSHVYLAGEGAMSFAKQQGFKILPPGSLITDTSKKDLEDFRKSLSKASCLPGTVGAVAIDIHGNVAAATSTGGLVGKMPGRIGDSPILGAGTYADNNSGCVSATGHGETFLRYNAASRILALVNFCNMSAQEAAVTVLDAMLKRFNQTGGVISIDHTGNLGIHFTTERMTWAYIKNGELHFGVDKGEDNVEAVKDSCE